MNKLITLALGLLFLCQPAFAQSFTDVQKQFLANENILSNPGCENGKTGWTVTAGTFTRDTSVKVRGSASCKVVLSSQTLSVTQDATLNAAQYNGTVQGLGFMRIKSDVALSLCARQAGTTSTSLCVSILATNTWNLYKIPFLLGSTSNGISLTSSGAVTGTVYFDDSFLGPVDLKADGPLVNTDYFESVTSPNGVGSTWTNNARYTTISKPRDAGILTYSDSASTGALWTANRAALVTVTIKGPYTTTGNSSLYVLKNQTGATFSGVPVGVSDRVVNLRHEVVASFSVVAGDKIGMFYAGSVAFTRDIEILNITAVEVTNSTTYTSRNSDTDWQTCAQGSGTQALGTSPTYSFQCKRQGSDLLMKGQLITTATPSASEARIALPLWNGVQLTSKNSSIIPTVQVAGAAGINASTSTWVPLIEPSVTYLTLGANVGSGAGTFTKQPGNAFAAGATIGILARIPIEGWENSNLAVLQLSGLQSCTDTFACTDSFSAFISGVNGNVSKENVDWLNGNCTASADTFTCPINTSKVVLTDRLNCSLAQEGGGRITTYYPTTSSTSQVVFKQNTTAGANSVDTGFTITCQKGADYLGKTAMAVASDQNVRATGSTGVDIQSVYFGGNATCSTACAGASGTCTICNRVGTKITSVSAGGGAGAYLINGIDGTKYNCSGTGLGTAYTPIIHFRSSSSTSYAPVQAANGGTGIDVGNANVTCIGIP